jgi:hypothetical protein
VVDAFMTTKRPNDPRDLLQQIRAKHPDTHKQWRIFHAAVLEDQRYLRSVIEHAFNAWADAVDRSVSGR